MALGAKDFVIVAVNEPDQRLLAQGLGELVALSLKADCAKKGVSAGKLKRMDIITADNRTITIER